MDLKKKLRVEIHEIFHKNSSNEQKDNGEKKIKVQLAVHTHDLVQANLVKLKRSCC